MIARRIGSTLCALLIAAGILFGAFLVGPALMGWERYVIVSGSMTGTYDRGSLVFDELVATKSLNVGDVITYQPPPGAGPKGLVTHRLVKIGHEKKTGTTYYWTKGDANPAKDPWTFTLPGKQQPRVVAGVPKAGFVLAALAERNVRMLIVGFPALLIAIFALVGLWRDSGREAAEAAEAAQAAEAAASTA